MKLKELFEAEQKVREQTIVEIAELFESCLKVIQMSKL